MEPELLDEVETMDLVRALFRRFDVAIFCAQKIKVVGEGGSSFKGMEIREVAGCPLRVRGYWEHLTPIIRRTVPFEVPRGESFPGLT